jgi:hypothetical protein
MYAMFQKMMNKMMSEQAGTSSEKNPFSLKDHATKKSTKSSKKHVQPEDTSEESADDTDEECEIIPEITRKPKVQAVTDPFQAQFKEMARVVKDLQARDMGKKVFTSEDFYDGLEGDDDLPQVHQVRWFWRSKSSSRHILRRVLKIQER